MPDDQGFQVYINFQPSQFDDDSIRTSEGYSVERLDNGVWTSLNSFYAYGSDNYQTLAVTLINSIEDDNGIITQENNSTFRIIAAMDEGILQRFLLREQVLITYIQKLLKFLKVVLRL